MSVDRKMSVNQRKLRSLISRYQIDITSLKVERVQHYKTIEHLREVCKRFSHTLIALPRGSLGHKIITIQLKYKLKKFDLEYHKYQERNLEISLNERRLLQLQKELDWHLYGC